MPYFKYHGHSESLWFLNVQKEGESLITLLSEIIAALFQILVLQSIFKDSGALINISVENFSFLRRRLS